MVGGMHGFGDWLTTRLKAKDVTQPTNDLPPVGAILSGPYWPGRVRVVRAEARGTRRALIEAVTLDDQARLISRLFKLEELAALTVETDGDRPALHSRGKRKLPAVAERYLPFLI